MIILQLLFVVLVSIAESQSWFMDYRSKDPDAQEAES